jgi:peptidoglycan/LPS O-acetylase OafA/YrhL
MAALTVFACYGSADIIRFMSNPLSSFLGRVSFPMYVLHFAVLVSLTSWMIVAGEPVFGLTIEFALGVIAISVVVALLAATIAERLERHYLRLVDRCIRRIMLP